MSDFTQMKNHEGFLIAWNPQKGDVRLVEIFGVKEFHDSPGGPSYIGQFVDRKISPNGPIRSNTLQSYVVENVEHLGDDAELGRVVKNFFEEHNSFIAVLLPEENLKFGFPKRKREKTQEIGRFGSLAFVGFVGEGDMPFIPKMTIMAGGFNLSSNLKLALNYDVNLMALYVFAWSIVRCRIDPDSVSPQQHDAWLKKTWSDGFNPRIEISCKNANVHGYCKKLQKRCVALEDRGEETHLDFRKCPIITEEVQKITAEKKS